MYSRQTAKSKQTEKRKTLYNRAKQKMLHNQNVIQQREAKNVTQQSIKCYNKQSTENTRWERGKVVGSAKERAKARRGKAYMFRAKKHE